MVKKFINKIYQIIHSNEFRRNLISILCKKHSPLTDYFNWGRDKRFIVDDSENSKFNHSKTNNLSGTKNNDWRSFLLQRNFFFKKFLAAINVLTFGVLQFIYVFGFSKGFINYITYKSFFSKTRFPKLYFYIYFNLKFLEYNDSYLLLSENDSKNLFCELLLLQILGENKIEISTFTKEFINFYEQSLVEILDSKESIKIYDKWILKKVSLKHPLVSIFTTPTFLNLIKNNILYTYHKDNVNISVNPGDVIIDAGVGSGDTAIYFAGIAGSKNKSGKIYSFEIMKEGLDVLVKQLNINPNINNVIPVNKALSNTSYEKVYIKKSGFGSKIVDYKTNLFVETITIDEFVLTSNISAIDFIKMDIEGSEIPALEGAKSVINKYKPKLAISVYHKSDDLAKIPKLISQIRSDYNYYLHCSTGFGGETILYCN